MERADVEISPGGGTMKRQAQAMTSPAMKEATAMRPCSWVILFFAFWSISLRFYTGKDTPGCRVAIGRPAPLFGEDLPGDLLRLGAPKLHLPELAQGLFVLDVKQVVIDDGLHLVRGEFVGHEGIDDPLVVVPLRRYRDGVIDVAVRDDGDVDGDGPDLLAEAIVGDGHSLGL